MSGIWRNSPSNLHEHHVTDSASPHSEVVAADADLEEAIVNQEFTTPEQQLDPPVIRQPDPNQLPLKRHNYLHLQCNMQTMQTMQTLFYPTLPTFLS